jgi:hypothetical protein
MPTAHHIADLAYPPHQGVGARLVRRLGGAVRSVIAGGITLAGSLRRPAAPRSGGSPTVSRKPAAPAAPERRRAPRRTLATATVPPVPAARTGWLARCFGRGQSEAAPPCRPSFADTAAPFTPEAYPGLHPEMCAILNTPVEDCDPEILHLVVAAFAELIGDALPSELRGLGGGELFSSLVGRLGTARGQAGHHGVPDVAPESAPAPSETAAPASSETAAPAPLETAAPAPLETAALALLEIAAPAPPEDAAPNALPGEIAARPALRGVTRGEDDAPVPAIAASEPVPDATVPPGPAVHARRTERHASRSLRLCLAWLARRSPWLFCHRCSRLCHRWRNLPQRPPARRLYYAACAGPP